MTDVRSAVAASDIDTFERFLDELVSASRAIVVQTRDRLTSEVKSDRTLVTETDRLIESRVREMIGAAFPAHGILGEEYGQVNETAAYQWILDPIDGTEELVAGLPLYGSIIGLFFQGRPLLASIDHPQLELNVRAGFSRGLFCNGTPFTGESSEFPHPRMVTANRKNFMRHQGDETVFDALHAAFPNGRIFSSCYAHTATALGAFDVGVEWNVKRWDIAATELLMSEAGGCFVDCSAQTACPEGLHRVVYGKAAFVEKVISVIERTLASE